MKRCVQLILIIFVVLLLALMFNSSKSFAVVQTDEIGNGANTGIVINGITMIENGKLVQSIENVTYDQNNNTLTLNNFSGESLRIVGMGKNFKINVVGNNEISGDSIFGGPRAGEGEIMYSYMEFIGAGTLNVKTYCMSADDIVINGPTINVTGSLEAVNSLNVKKGTLAVTKSGNFLNEDTILIDSGTFKYNDNIEVTDKDGKKVYYVEKVLDYTIEENSDGSKTYWVTEDDGLKVGYSEIPYVRGFCYSNTYSKDNLVTNIVMKEKVPALIEKEEINTGIKLQGTTAIIPNDVILNAKFIEKENITSIGNNINNFIAYDITLTLNGETIQPNGNVKISLPIPDGYNKEKLIVYRIQESGEKIEYDVKVEENYATFETNHFSTYILAEFTENSTDNNSNINNNFSTTTNDERELDETPKTGTIDLTYYIIPVAILSAVGIAVTIKRKQAKH